MIQLRKGEDRGQTSWSWLESYHTFSFGQYRDPHHMGFRTLRVINEDFVHPGQGFGMHFHRDMEILTYVLQGAIEHRDSLGNQSILKAGELQRMTAGKGIRHSEFNPSKKDPLHLLQIWILPNQKGLDPSYEQREFKVWSQKDRLHLVASPDGQEHSLKIHQDARVYLAHLESGGEVNYSLEKGRGAWIQVTRGEVRIGDQVFKAGDGAAVEEIEKLQILGEKGESEILLFDLQKLS